MADDNAFFARDILRLQNFHMLEARDGQDAVDLCERRPGPIDLLLTDVVMPRMGGRLLADHLCQNFPGLRVLFMS